MFALTDQVFPANPEGAAILLIASNACQCTGGNIRCAWHVQYYFWHAAGCYADWVIVKEEFLAYAPASLKLDTACGAVPLASLTAFTVR